MNARSITVPAWFLGLTLGLTSIAAGQHHDPKEAVDQTLAALRSQQQSDGSYGNDPVATAKVLLAYSRSHRKYAEVDGPFVRGAVNYLLTVLDSNGWPKASSPEEATRQALWISAALTEMKGEAAQAAARQMAVQLAIRPPRSTPDPEWYPLAATAGKVDLAAALAGHMHAVLQSPRTDALALRRFPAVLQLIAQFDPGLEVATPAGPTHWALAAAASLLTAAPPQDLEDQAAYSRALSLCKNLAPPQEGGFSPPALSGSQRGPVRDLALAYDNAAKAALEFLASNQENGRFGFMGQADPGITSMALAAVLRTCARQGSERPGYVDLGLDWLKALQDPSGAIHAGGVKVYVTSAAVFALKIAAREGDQECIDRALTYLKSVQADESEGYDSEVDWAYGGIGYGGDLRPDLSNTQFGLEALHVGGVDSQDEAFQRALVFLQRCQNDPEINDRAVVRADGRTVQPGQDGGAVYYPGDSKAGLIELANGQFVARSYGSMTYALLKSYIFAGLEEDDPRLQAALDWIRKNYTVEYNPGFDRVGQPGSEYQGLYYYYYTMAKALDASGLEVVETPAGKRKAWRQDLAQHLLSIGYREGFWSNQKSARWWEEMPILATSYSLVALDFCMQG
jgi:squalene-hopene/tetraprenyl-beta-curcumene cyclase